MAACPAGELTVVQSEQANAPHPQLFIATDIGEELMAAFYLQLLHDGLLPVVFYDRIPSITEYLGWLSRPNSRYLGCFMRNVQPLDGVELCGMGWLFDIQGPPGCMRADTGFVFLKKYHRTRIPRDLTKKMLDYAFHQVGLDVVYGITPTRNRMAVAFSKRLGFHQVGPLPKYGAYHGEPCDAIMSFMSKEEFRG